MNENDQVVRNDLGDVIAAVPVGDCRLEFRRQRATGDLWCVESGPLAIIAVPMIPADILDQVRSGRTAMDAPVAQRARARYAKWQQVRIDEDLLIAIRARGGELEWHYLFGDGVPFGGGSSWLPTARPATLLARAQMWLSGRRGSRVDFGRHTDEGVH